MWVQFYQITRGHIPDDSYLRNCGCFSFETTQNTGTGCFRVFHQLLQFNDGQVVVPCKIPNSFIEESTSFRNIYKPPENSKRQTRDINKIHTKDPKLLGATGQNVVARDLSSCLHCHPSYRCLCLVGAFGHRTLYDVTYGNPVILLHYVFNSNHWQNVRDATGLYGGRQLLSPTASFFLRPAVRTSAPTPGW